jgi:SAM-dependent methyltransferase
MLETIKCWLHFTKRYLGNPRWDTGVSPPELVAFLESNPAGRALDVGCGTGTNLVTMTGYGWDVIGVDMIPIAVIKARSKLKMRGQTGKVIWGDISQPLMLRGKFDLILDMGCYHSLSSQAREKYRGNIQRWLHPEGTYLIYAHLPKDPASNHGFRDTDLRAFSTFLHLDWRQQNPEKRPDGSVGRPSVWMKFHRAKDD